MGGILHADMKTALKFGDAFAVFEFDDPGGTTYQYAGGWIDSKNLGQYKGFIPKGGFGKSGRSIPLRGDRLQSANITVRVHDEDGVLTELTSGQYSRQIRGMVARIRIVAPGVDPEAYYLRFQGQIIHPTKEGDIFVFELGPKAPELETLIRVPIITQATWPNAHVDALEKRVQLCYGIHDSSALGNRGMLPTLYVDTDGFRYMASHQHIEGITNVFVDDVIQGSGWSEERVIVEGNYYTLINFDSDQEESTITFDAEGAAWKGDPDTYDPITNPATQFKTIMANYVFHAWNGNPVNWHSETDSPIHAELLNIAEAFFNNRGVPGAISVTDAVTGLSLINRWAEQFYPVFWTSDAKLAVRPDDWYKTEIEMMAEEAKVLADRVWLREDEHFLKEMKYNFSDEMLTDEWSVGFLYSEADGIPLRRTQVTDTLRGWNIADELELTWAESSL